MKNKGISVIMASYLGEYDGCASNRENKFERAVNSFISQDYIGESELVIVSDGCQKTIDIYMEKFSDIPNIICLSMEKKPLFSGLIRSTGIKHSSYDIICYLDSDDLLGNGHLTAISDGFSDDLDWVYFDYYLNFPKGLRKRTVVLSVGGIGTSGIAHKKYCEARWGDGWGHDWSMILSLRQRWKNYAKIEGADYRVCHIKDCLDA